MNKLFLVLIIFLIIFIYLNLSNKKEGYDNLDYSRVYPGLFAYQQNYLESCGYSPSFYRDYWYIPAHEYLDFWMNGKIPNQNCLGN